MGIRFPRPWVRRYVDIQEETIEERLREFLRAYCLRGSMVAKSFYGVVIVAGAGALAAPVKWQPHGPTGTGGTSA